MMREILALHAAGELNKAQESWFKPPGEEQLYDTLNDPFELNNLAADSQYREIKHQMSNALEKWLQQTGDWSEQPESIMVEGFLKNGKAEVTEAPEIYVLGSAITIACSTVGASIGYRLDDGAWQLYSGPFTTGTGVIVTAKAVRYGWNESEETTKVMK
jgi:hypothetical protein